MHCRQFASIVFPLAATLWIGCSGGSSALDASTDGTDAARSDGALADAMRSDANRTDGGLDAARNDGGLDAALADTSVTDTGASGCGTESWPTYGHDARRSFASAGCVRDVPREAWRYTPTPPDGRTLNSLQRVIAQTDAVFLTWSASATPYIGTTAADRVTVTGTRVWTFSSGSDASFGYWPSLALGKVVLDDDGLYFLDPGTGSGGLVTSVDYWGQTFGDDTHLYGSNVLKADGPGLFVGEFDTQAHQVWAKNTYGMCGMMQGQSAGGIALENGTLFYAPTYVFEGSGTPPLASGVYAFDPADGTQRWYQSYVPTTSVSAGAGLLYFADSAKLYALRQSDGSVAWQQAMTSLGPQAPILAGSLVIVGGQSGITALDAATGASRWTSTVSFYSGGIGAVGNGCAGGEYPLDNTNMVAAMGSNTLVVAAQNGLAVLSLTDGHTVGQLPAEQFSLHDPVVVGTRIYAVAGQSLIAYDAP